MKLFRSKKNVLVLGSKGMLGSELLFKLQKMACLKKSCIGVVRGLDYPEIDLSNPYALTDFFSNENVKFDYVVNCAAITNTKAIADDLETNAKSYEVNALACKHIALWCAYHRSKLIHISTDYVFSEKSDYSARRHECPISNLLDNHRSYSNMFDDEYPINDYGLHKLVGELFIKTSMDKEDYAIIRVSWLYGKNGHKSFIHKFLKNCWNIENKKSAGKGKKAVSEVTVTDDEMSIPTNVENLCQKIVNVMKYNLSGVFNGADSYNEQAEDQVTRYEFAKKIFEMFDGGFKNLKLVPVHMKDPEGTKMAYPKLSKMKNEDNVDFLEDTCSWEMALARFIDVNRDEIKSWLENS